MSTATDEVTVPAFLNLDAVAPPELREAAVALATEWGTAAAALHDLAHRTRAWEAKLEEAVRASGLDRLHDPYEEVLFPAMPAYKAIRDAMEGAQAAIRVAESNVVPDEVPSDDDLLS